MSQPLPAAGDEAAASAATVRVVPVRYLVTAWPEDLAARADAASFCVTVARRPRGLWAVLDSDGMCLGRDGAWTVDRPPEDKAERQAWIAAHRFPWEEARELACKAAPGVAMAGMTALQAIAWHRKLDEEEEERAARAAATAGTGGQETVTNDQ